MARRHPPEQDQPSEAATPQSLRGEQQQAAGEIMGAVLSLVTLGAAPAELD